MDSGVSVGRSCSSPRPVSLTRESLAQLVDDVVFKYLQGLAGEDKRVLLDANDAEVELKEFHRANRLCKLLAVEILIVYRAVHVSDQVAERVATRATKDYDDALSGLNNSGATLFVDEVVFELIKQELLDVNGNEIQALNVSNQLVIGTMRKFGLAGLRVLLRTRAKAAYDVDETNCASGLKKLGNLLVNMRQCCHSGQDHNSSDW